jgi:hypothetical protein
VKRALLLATLVACSKSSPPKSQEEKPKEQKPAAKADRFAPVVPPKVSALCEKVRADYFGIMAECTEREMPELASAAGKVVIVENAHDPAHEYVLALVPPQGDPVVSGAYDLYKTIVSQLDVPNTPPDLLARLFAELSTGDAIALPDPTPAIADGVLTFTLEEFPDPSRHQTHQTYRYKAKVGPHSLDDAEGGDSVQLDPNAPRPPQLPPLPGMSAPPDWTAKPEKAPDEVSKKLCENHDGTCVAYAYPSVKLPNGAIYYLANDTGTRNDWVFQRTDGTILRALANEATPALGELVTSWATANVAPETFLAAWLLLEGEPARILCLPGSGDVIPDHDCKAPTAKPEGDHLTLNAIVEELPYRDGMGMVQEPAVRDRTYEFTPGGGMSSDGPRLVDMRPPDAH